MEAMRALALAALAAGISTGGAHALEDRHDEKLARAAADIVASRMGPLRGSLDIGDRITSPLPKPAPAVRRQATQVPPPAGVWQDGLAVAIERKPSASPDL